MGPSATPLAALMEGPITTRPNTTSYEWAGGTLRHLLGLDGPVAETWPFFSGASQPAMIEETPPGAGPMTMAELIAQAPEVLGPCGGDPQQGGQKYFFVKLLDPSDFPPFAYVGFNPDATGQLRVQLEREQRAPFADEAAFAQALRLHVEELLWQDRRAVEALGELVRGRVTDEEHFQRWKAAYKAWAIAQARGNWAQAMPIDLEPFVPPGEIAAANALLIRQHLVRRQLVGLLHRIDFADDQAILIESPTLHAIAGLSLQLHPRAPGNFFPKDELWIYQSVFDASGTRIGWVLVEPQRTFDKTESGADFFTPFAWTDGHLGFRKAITEEYLKTFVELMDATPRPESSYVRTAQPLEHPPGVVKGAARWVRLVEETGWPYFLVRQLCVDGAGEATTLLDHHCFIELHATQGAIEATLSGEGCSDRTFTVTPARPVFLPACLPYETITYRASAPARLFFFTRPKPAA